MVTLLTDDAVIMPPDSPAVVGKTEIRKWVETFPPVTHFATKIVQANGHGDLAMTRGAFEMTMELVPGQQLHMTGKWVANFIRLEGKWLCCLDIWNLDHPLTTP